MTPPPSGRTSLTAQQHSQLDGVIVSSWLWFFWDEMGQITRLLFVLFYACLT